MSTATSPAPTPSITPGPDRTPLKVPAGTFEVNPDPGLDPVSRRDWILDAAAGMFAQYGYYGSSLRKISRRANISHPGMLHHFRSKDALLAGVIDRLEAHAQDALNRREEFCRDVDALLEGLARVWNPTAETVQLLARLDAEAVRADHPGRFRMARLRRVHEHVLERCFAQLAERGLLREGLTPAFAARAVLALVLTHAARERTVRLMQHDTHHDAPAEDLDTLVRAFLADPGC